MTVERKRAGLFEDAIDDIDLSGFGPQTVLPPKPTQQQALAVSAAANFPSRQTKTQESVTTTKPLRRFRTGRNIQFNAKASRETIDSFYAICDRTGWVMGYTLERAVEALGRELSASSGVSSQSAAPPIRKGRNGTD